MAGDALEPDNPVTCARCARTPRDEEDLARWVSVESDPEEVCPGCLTLHEVEHLRNGGEAG
jgi:hypothetical protein